MISNYIYNPEAFLIEACILLIYLTKITKKSEK